MCPSESIYVIKGEKTRTKKLWFGVPQTKTSLGSKQKLPNNNHCNSFKMENQEQYILMFSLCVWAVN